MKNLLLITLITLFCLTIADVEDDRELEFQFSNNQAEFQSHGDDVELKFKVAIEGGFKVAFEAHTDGEVELENQMEWRFEDIIEFLDAGEPGYTNETIVKSTAVNSITWNPMSCQAVAAINSSSITALNRLVTCTLTSTNNIWKFTAYMASLPVSVGNATTSSGSIKIDVAVTNYNWTNTNNSLALTASIKTETEHDDGHDSNEEDGNWERMDMNNGDMFVSWSKNLESSAVNATVVKTAGNSNDDFIFTFTPPGQTFYNWDPKFGFANLPTVANSSSSIIMSLFALFLVFLV